MAQVKPPAQTWTRSDFTDFQTDLMLFIGDVPETQAAFQRRRL